MTRSDVNGVNSFLLFNSHHLLRSAFTISEVIITLGIIGVVAAISIPALLNNIQDTQYKTAYKKAYSAASQAVLSANQQELFVYASSEGDVASHKANFLAFESQFKVTKECISNNNGDCWDSTGEKYGLGWSPTGTPFPSSYAFVDSSGIAWSMYYTGSIRILVDTNGFKKPNQYGKDRFLFYLYNQNVSSYDSGIPSVVKPSNDNSTTGICVSPNKCATELNYWGQKWLYN